MTIYADYNYYISTYNGQLSQSLFDKFSTQASLKIKNATHNRATSENEQIKLCMCELVDSLNKNQKFINNIFSEKVDTYSRNFVQKSKKEIDQEYRSIINEYLGLTGLLYGGGILVY